MSTQQYQLANQHRALEMDGNELVSTSLTIMRRISILMEQLRPISHLDTTCVQKIVAYTSLFRLFYLIFSSYPLPTALQNLHCNPWLKARVDDVFRLLVMGLKKSDLLFTIASIASYVALGVLGSPIHAILGGGSILLVMFKRQKRLDPRIHNLIVFISNSCCLLKNVLRPQFWLYRVINIIEHGYNLLSFNLSNKFFSN